MKSNHHWAMKIGTEGDWDALSGRDTTKSPSTTKSRKTLCLTRHIKGCVFSSTTCAPSFSRYFAFACAGESEGHPVLLFQPVLHTAWHQIDGCSSPCDSQLLSASAQRVPSDLNVFSCCPACRGASCLAAAVGSGPCNWYHSSSSPA